MDTNWSGEYSCLFAVFFGFNGYGYFDAGLYYGCFFENLWMSDE